MFDLSLGKLLVIGVLALFLVGPESFPLYAAKLGQWVRIARGMIDGAKERVREAGPEFDDVDWQRLDPRRYDPRRIVREALLDEPVRARPQSPRPARGYDELVEPEQPQAVEVAGPPNR